MAKLKYTPPDKENQIYSRLETEDGKIFMGIHPVLFGARIRCGYVGDHGVILDWCCGDDNAIIALTYDVVRSFLERGGDIRKLPPVSDPKPWYKDDNFSEQVEKEFHKLRNQPKTKTMDS